MWKSSLPPLNERAVWLLLYTRRQDTLSAQPRGNPSTSPSRTKDAVRSSENPCGKCPFVAVQKQCDKGLGEQKSEELERDMPTGPRLILTQDADARARLSSRPMVARVSFPCKETSAMSYTAHVDIE